MNTHSVSLSSPTISYTSVLPTILMEDHSKLSINLTKILATTIPLYVHIDWGDGKIELYDNNIFRAGVSINNTTNYSPIFQKNYTREYYPSSHSLYKSISAQVLVNYVSGEYTWFVIPIIIRSYDYFDSIKDIKLENTNIIPTSNNQKEHQFKIMEGGFLVETRGTK